MEGRQIAMFRDQVGRDAAATAFAEADVAACYIARPPYAPALYDVLLARVPRRRQALDLGCGPGKIAVVLAEHFDKVVALDPSPAIIAAGKAADAGCHGNIRWVTQRAEDFRSDEGFDLVTAGTSIAWPEHAVVFPKLAKWTSMLAVVTGDALRNHPCGEEAWVAFLRRWLGRMARRTRGVRPYDAAAFSAEGRRHEVWLDISGREHFAFTFRQSVEDFITCQHSRATWSRRAMGEALAAEFDAELDSLVRPFATNGALSLDLVSELTWGSPRKTARA